MKTTVIANPLAAAGKVGRQWSRYERAIIDRFGMSDVRMTTRAGEAKSLAREAVRDGAEQVVVVGGDGTINEAVNGFFSPNDETGGSKLPTLVFLPAGTGGDFARSVGLRGLSPKAALEAESTRPIDLGRVELRGPDGEPVVHYFINIASFGSSALIVDKVNTSPKFLGGEASFLIGTLRGLFSWRDRRVRLRVDDLFDDEIDINTVAMANGRYFGGGMKVAPLALVDDGELDVIIVGGAGLLAFLRHSGKLYRGTHLGLPIVTSLKGKTISAESVDNSETPIYLEADGEAPGFLPLRCTVLPGAVDLLAPWPRAEAALNK
ncbi:MAG: diacylglycerol kinase family lipid kinase [Deltaproteobacteria bacterium]|nr:diacylglycerol kinase family lipid kinase [Deltaproteobacteria bacterium]